MSEKIEKPKVDVGFAADESLMYLIQQTTNLETEEILGFFYDLATKILEIGIEKMEGHGIRKDVRDMFPGTAIPFKILVKGQKRSYYNYKLNKTENEHFSGSIEVTFPDKTRQVDQKALVEKIIERTLLDGESLPRFPKPPSKTPRMYKELIEAAMKSSIKG